jgi:hypothetical protein
MRRRVLRLLLRRSAVALAVRLGLAPLRSSGKSVLLG